MTGGVAFTLAVEIGFPFLVWRKSLRGKMLVMAALMHVGIAVLMGLTTFSLTMMTLLLTFTPPEWIHRLKQLLDEFYRVRLLTWRTWRVQQPTR